jgi:DNA-binding transcriptional MerR regulator
MRIAELSERSGVPRSTIKFYLREGLLPAGAAHARNQASYGGPHLERLRLVRALREVCGLPLEAVARVARELDRGWRGDPYREAMRALGAPPSSADGADDLAALRTLTAEVRAFLRDQPWTTDDERHFFAEDVAAALLAVRRHLFPDFAVGSLRAYADVAWLLSEAEFELAPGGARVPREAAGDDVAEPIRRAILGTVLFERIFAALRRTANAARSTRLSTGARVPKARLPRVAKPRAKRR